MTGCKKFDLCASPGSPVARSDLNVSLLWREQRNYQRAGLTNFKFLVFKTQFYFQKELFLSLLKQKAEKMKSRSRKRQKDRHAHTMFAQKHKSVIC